MKKLPLILSVGSVALLLGGCPSSSPTNQSQPITQESPTATAPPPPANNPSVAAPPSFSGATQPAAPPSAVAGLIPATDPDQKRAEIARGRVDPTALFPLNPDITVKVTEEQTTTTVRPPTSSSRPATSSIRVGGGSSSGSTPTRGTTRPATSLPSLPPPPPQPTEARGVQVSGIVQLPTTPMAIVKAPGERTERRVIPGSTLSNGTIVVRSIDTNPDDPSIVLEQYGQTVIRKLGAGMPTATTPAGAAPSQSAMIYPDTIGGGS